LLSNQNLFFSVPSSVLNMRGSINQDYLSIFQSFRLKYFVKLLAFCFFFMTLIGGDRCYLAPTTWFIADYFCFFLSLCIHPHYSVCLSVWLYFISFFFLSLFYLTPSSCIFRCLQISCSCKSWIRSSEKAKI